MASRKSLKARIRLLEIAVKFLAEGATIDRRETMNHLTALYESCTELRNAQQINKPSKGHT